MTASDTMPNTMPDTVRLTDSVDSDLAEERGTRGRTTIADRVVERLAVHAAREVEGVGGSARRLLGVRVTGEAPRRSVQASAHVSGGSASLRVQLSVRYPTSVARTVERARDHIMRRVTELTGLEVSRVDVTVTALHGDTEPRRTVQ
ncbi:putative alkaline shock family protein YloU [Saccharomonospora amisosensis]|uniref:Putative alkaline shock family protein YloU n=1 Tax=Saccharomonospora amisosensis TaxID=1128677 RepID=A0A7X5UMB5_9PSEU|nr:Asp23/Gls24 family envelope stress response protein [Saccharomonospora amisosensis]NIJ10651.1 putative alkaline shock family protein YloU [Saccharomonospora amisosensis]